MTPETAVQEAIVGALLADDAVIEIVGDSVFDEVPSGVQPPYLYIGPMERSRVETGCGPAWTIRTRLYAISTAFGRAKAWTLADAAIKALDGREFELPGPFQIVGEAAVTRAGDVLEPANPKAVFTDVSLTLVEDEE